LLAGKIANYIVRQIYRAHIDKGIIIIYTMCKYIMSDPKDTIWVGMDDRKTKWKGCLNSYSFRVL
jgi:hypothetical protein